MSEPIPTAPRRRLLVLVVAHDAAATLPAVLAEVPPSFPGADHHLLVVDDGSRDATFEVARGLSRADGRSEVLCTHVAQGHGGSQKVGYRYAIDEGFDAVLVLHGAGRYRPEVLRDVVRPVLSGEADCVLGARVTARRGDSGAVPGRELVGARLLTRVQNSLLGTRIGDLHTGLRAYAVTALASVPFEADTDGDHFDSELLIQLLRRGLVVAEIPVPAECGRPVRRGAALVHAWQAVRTTLASRLHDLGVFFQLRYELRRDSEVYELKLGYQSSHTMALARVPPGSKVLDLGCGPGKLGREMRRAGCTVHGVDAVDRLVPEAVDRFTLADLETMDVDLAADAYDVILLLDIIEHLSSPESFLRRLRVGLGSTSPAIVVSVPNVGFLPVRLRLLLGGFEYGREGVLDLTHRRLFTLKSVCRTLRQQGFRVHRAEGVPAPFPKAIGDGRLARALLALNRWLIGVSRGLFAYQILLDVEALPTVPELLRRTRAASAARASGTASG